MLKSFVIFRIQLIDQQLAAHTSTITFAFSNMKASEFPWRKPQLTRHCFVWSGRMRYDPRQLWRLVRYETRSRGHTFGRSHLKDTIVRAVLRTLHMMDCYEGEGEMSRVPSVKRVPW